MWNKKKTQALVYCSAKINKRKLKTVDVLLYEGEIKQHESTQRDLLAQKNLKPCHLSPYIVCSRDETFDNNNLP